MPEKMTVEESFRSSLEDLKVIIEHIGSFCSTMEEFSELVSLGISNDGQLKLLMSICAGTAKKK